MRRWSGPRPPARPTHLVMRRASAYATAVVRGLHLRYAAAYGLAHLLPPFTAGPVVARLYRAAGFHVGRGTSFLGPVRIRSSQPLQANLEIGRNVLISTDVTINVDAPVHIEDGVSIGPGVMVYTGTHDVGAESCRMAPTPHGRPVTIERGAWVRLAAIVLPGVTIGHGSIVAAGSVVTTDVKPNTYVQGNPAQAVRCLPPDHADR